MLTAVILAGGLGTRLRSVVTDIPKSMALISGRPFLEYQLDYWIKQGVNRFVLAVGYKHCQIINHFGSRYKEADIEYVIEESPLGTGGAILLALDKISEDTPFLLLNGDTYFQVDLSKLIEFSIINKSDWCFALFRTKEKKRYLGVELGPLDEIVSFKMKDNLENYMLVNGGVYLLRSKSLFNGMLRQGEVISLENQVFSLAKVFGLRLFGLEFDVPFIDIGIPEDYFRAQNIIKSIN